MQRESLGTYTVLTQMRLSGDERRKLEHLVRAGHATPADIVSALVSGMAPVLPAGDAPPDMLPVPVHVYLTAEQRAELERYAAEHEQVLGTIVSAMLSQALGEMQLPEDQGQASAAPVSRPSNALLEQLRARRQAAGRAAPRWLDDYIAQLEQEQRRI